MTLNEALQNRLLNWKFTQAFQLVDEDVSEEETELLEALSHVFANIGWFDGALAVIVAQVVDSLVDPEG